MYKDLRGLQKSSEVSYDLWLWSQEFCCYDKHHGNEFHCQQFVAGGGKGGGGGFGLDVKWGWSRVQNQ